ncbi:hypothetical protein EIN_053450 [Entamoeba invadens IP1]|uniref:hypothetical protein n=1 Tax=Entamoeba invadens IP1 TaxID=370355 RepID=UPI0002C3F203|nr:hypothetical protein EIN_053450 [Entamoeba invadens IP1]ELP93100.1 hypothetical protein EIN_053450 [Entamoeba invadens IP1]|eukprot:XP_004259871.1 hypothetical protein EIN_053450 [Entamoeba invadens IP1]
MTQTQDAITHLVLLGKNGENTPVLLHTTGELNTTDETFMMTTAFPDQETKLPDYVYFNNGKTFGVSVVFNGRKEWKYKKYAIVAFVTVPYLHQIVHILLPLANAYITQVEEINVTLIGHMLTVANYAFSPIYTSAPTATALVNRLDTNVLCLLKLFLLEKRVLVVASREQALLASETVLFLLSLVPGVFFTKPNLKEVDLLQLPLSLNTEEREVYLHLSINNFDRIGNGNGVIAAVSTNVVLQKSPDYDAVVDVSTGKILYRDKNVEMDCSLTKTDKVFIFNVKKEIRVNAMSTTNVEKGTDNWVFRELVNYIMALLHGLARNKELFTKKPFRFTSALEEVFVDFGEAFVRAFLQTNCFHNWREKMTNVGMEGKSFERVHPSFEEGISTSVEENLKSFFNNDFTIGSTVAFNDFASKISAWSKKSGKKTVKEEGKQDVPKEVSQDEKPLEKDKEMKIEKAASQKEVVETTEDVVKEDDKVEVAQVDVAKDKEGLTDPDHPADFFFS